jgi:hypothetical protein
MIEAIERILHRPGGNIALSVLLGAGLAAIFHKTCNDGSCTVYVAPKQRDVLLKQFAYDDQCYEYEAHDVACNDPSKTFIVQSRR